MDDQWIYPSESQADAAAQLDARQRAQDELWVELRNEDDPDRRMALLSEFGHNRAAIEVLTRRLASGTGPSDHPDDGGVSYRVELVDQGLDDLADEDEDAGGAAPSVVDAGDPVDGELVDGDLPDGDLVDGELVDGDLVDGEVGSRDLDDGDWDASRPGESRRERPTLAKSKLIDSGLAVSGLESSPITDPAVAGEPLGEQAPVGRDDSGIGDPVLDQPVKPLSFDDSGDLVELDDHDAAAFLVPDEPFDHPRGGSSANNGEGADGPADTIFGQPRTDGGFAPSPPSATRPAGSFDDQSNTRRAADDERSRALAEGRRRGHVPPTGSHRAGGGHDAGADPYGFGRSPGVPARPAPRGPSPSRGRGPVAGPAATSQYPAVRGPRSAKPAPEKPSRSGRRGVLLLGGLAAALAVSWLLLGRGSGDAPTSVASEVASDAEGEAPAGPGADAGIDEILAMLAANGLDTIAAERRGDVIFLTGSVPTSADRDIAIGLAQGVVADPVDGSELLAQQPASGAQPAAAATPRAAALQNELRRVVAATPIIFGIGETAITDLHARILNSVASIMAAYPELQVTVVGFTDDTGSETSNRQISLARAENVTAYLVAQGVPAANLAIDARGEDVASGSEAIANLERRVEFEVSGAEAAVGGSTAAPIRIAIVAPSARNDLAFTQSMVDAVDVVAAERGNVEVAITDNTFVPEDAAAAIRDYASQGYDLVIAHGSQFGTSLIDIAGENPDVAFAWGTASDTFGLPNVYAYDAAAGQGGFVMGSMSTLLSQTGVVGVVGPIEVGDAQLYVNGFRAGALSSKPDATVLVTYTGSFSDLTLAAEVARSQVGSGADVMTGSAQMVVGAVSVANERNALWFGNQANQTSLAPSLVVASQVYHWEVILRQIVDDLDAGTQGGRTYTADLANGGLVIEYNPDYPLPEAVRQRADQVTAGIVDGSIVVPSS